MKKSKIKTLIIGMSSTLLLTSTIAMANPNTNELDINKSPNYVTEIPPHLTALEILGYSDGLHFTRGKSTITDLFAVKSKSATYDLLYWSSAKSAILFLAVNSDTYGAGHPNAFLDGADVPYSYVNYDHPIDINALDLVEFDVPQGRHTLKLVIVDPRWNAPVSVLTDSINVRASALSSYNVNAAIPVNQVFKYKLPKQVASNVNLANYVGVFDANGNQVSASIKLGSDNQTLIITPPNGQYQKNSAYQLIINCGITFADNTELFDVTLIDFVTKNTTPTTSTNSSLTKQSLVNPKEQSLKSIDIDGNNVLNNNDLKNTSKDKSNTVLENVNKLRNSLKNSF